MPKYLAWIMPYDGEDAEDDEVIINVRPASEQDQQTYDRHIEVVGGPTERDARYAAMIWQQKHPELVLVVFVDDAS